MMVDESEIVAEVDLFMCICFCNRRYVWEYNV